MGMMKEFKEFALKGNLMDMSIAFVMGAAFGKVSSAFIDGMVMPLVGKLTSGEDFSKLVWKIQNQVVDATGAVTTPEVTVKYGSFITEVINFIIVAFVMFMIVKKMNRMRKKEEAAPAAPPAPTADQQLLTEIRDLLKK